MRKAKLSAIAGLGLAAVTFAAAGFYTITGESSPRFTDSRSSTVDLDNDRNRERFAYTRRGSINYLGVMEGNNVDTFRYVSSEELNSSTGDLEAKHIPIEGSQTLVSGYLKFDVDGAFLGDLSISPGPSRLEVLGDNIDHGMKWIDSIKDNVGYFIFRAIGS